MYLLIKNILHKPEVLLPNKSFSEKNSAFKKAIVYNREWKLLLR
jgi:hypothetical protein